MKLWILKNGQNFCRYGDISINGQICPNKLLLETYARTYIYCTPVALSGLNFATKAQFL